jgi:hypothetical protein
MMNFGLLFCFFPMKNPFFLVLGPKKKLVLLNTQESHLMEGGLTENINK